MAGISLAPKILKASDRYTFHGDARLFTFVYGVRVRTNFRPNSCLIFYYDAPSS